jgi:hypothetical protein
LGVVEGAVVRRKRPSQKAVSLLIDFLDSRGRDRDIYAYIGGLEYALRKCRAFIGIDSMGDEAGRDAWDAAEDAFDFE